MESPEHQKRAIRQYFETQVDDETIEHLEKVASEQIFGRTHDVWDVHTDKDRWWVVTDPTNLYSQRDFRSMDYVISFHVGLMARIVARQRASASEEQRGRLSVAWRRFEQAYESLAEAEEAEDIQAVGMKCRECLLAFVREVREATAHHALRAAISAKTKTPTASRPPIRSDLHFEFPERQSAASIASSSQGKPRWLCIAE